MVTRLLTCFSRTEISNLFISFHWWIMSVSELWGKMIITTLAGKCHEIDHSSVSHFISELAIVRTPTMNPKTTSNKAPSIQKYHCIQACQFFVRLALRFQSNLERRYVSSRKSHANGIPRFSRLRSRRSLLCSGDPSPTGCLGIEAISPSSISSADIEADPSFDSFSAASLMFHAHCTRNPKVDPELLWRLPSWICNFTNKKQKRLTSIRLKTPLAIRVGDLWSSWLSALSLSLLWKEVLQLALGKMLKCQTTLLFEAPALVASKFGWYISSRDYLHVQYDHWFKSPQDKHVLLFVSLSL